MRVVLTVNGRDQVLDVAAGTSLLEVLRDDLGLYAAKYGCGEGQCGACCVLVDGRSVPACTTRVDDLAGHKIVTLEGLAGAGGAAVQDAFVAEGAMQCGYCTAGMVIAAAALLDRMPHPTDGEIREALEPHLCRCGGYGRVVAAVRRAGGAR
jgi:nicotinate dehydrogenase subunit A